MNASDLRLIRYAVATIWLVTGVVVLTIYPKQDSLDMLARVGLSGLSAMVALYGCGTGPAARHIDIDGTRQNFMENSGRFNRRVLDNYYHIPARVLDASIRADIEKSAHTGTALAAIQE
jgi:hypothetical protein